MRITRSLIARLFFCFVSTGLVCQSAHSQQKNGVRNPTPEEQRDYSNEFPRNTRDIDPFADDQDSQLPDQPSFLIFEISKVGGEKELLLKVFTAVQNLENEQKASKDNEQKSSTSNFKVIQRLSARRFLVTNGSRNYLIESEVDLNYVDDEIMKELHIESTDELFEYTNTLNVKSSVRVLKAVPKREEREEEAMTKEQFVERSKRGVKWVLRDFLEQKCGICHGVGQTGTLMRGKRICSSCSGQGRVLNDLWVKW
jgi:hypothetical protein